MKMWLNIMQHSSWYSFILKYSNTHFRKTTAASVAEAGVKEAS